MARLERPTEKSSNPATRFLEWKSDEKQFSYYDKEKGENIPVELPLKVLFMEHYHTVKGWHDPSQSGIYANEVFLISQEPMTVKSFKGGEIASGIYKEIKGRVNDAGGTYHRSVYVMLEDGSLANVAFKGASVGGIKKEKAIDKEDHIGYSDFVKANQSKLDYHWIVIDGAHEAKSGKVKYSIPNFTIGDRITEAEDKKATEAAATLQEYMNNYMKPEKEEPRANSEVDKYEAAHATADLDDLDI